MLSLWSRLSPEGKRAARRIHREYRKGHSPTLEHIWESDYERVPVSPTKFIRDPFYLGSQIQELHDNWVREIETVYGRGAVTREWLITGSIGGGKTTAATAAMLYSIYRLSCMRDPAERYGLRIKGSKIVFGIFNITLARSDTAYENMKMWVDGSPYFQQHCPRQKRPGSTILFPSKRIEVVQGSLGEHVLGENLFGMMLDEANFWKAARGHKTASVEERTRAHKIYEQAVAREISRFQRFGSAPGTNILISSRQTADSFLEGRIAQAKVRPGIHVSCFALWEVKPASDFSGKKFEVMVGSDVKSSRILEPDEIAPRGYKVVQVPVEYREPFENNVDDALRDIANVPVSARGRFFNQVEKVHACVDPLRVHPFSVQSVTDISTDNPANNLIDYLKTDVLYRTVRSSHALRKDPGIARVGHVDIGLTGDPLGLAIGHLVPGTQQLWYDILLEVLPPEKGEIELEAIVDFFKALRSLGMAFSSVTYDTFQSRQSLQQLTKAGFKAGSVGPTYEVYAALRKRVYAGQSACNYYHYPPFLKQLLELERSPFVAGDPDHPPNGKKDVADAAAAVAYILTGQATQRAGRKTNYRESAIQMLPRLA